MIEKINDYKKLYEYSETLEHFQINDYLFYVGIVQVNKEIPVEEIRDLLNICHDFYEDNISRIKMGEELAKVIYQDKYLTLEQLERIPSDNILEYYYQDEMDELENYFDSVDETITSIKDIKKGNSYTMARVLDNGYCVELHYCSDTGATIEYGEKMSKDYWSNRVEKIEWFNTNLTDDYVLNRLRCLYEDMYSDKEIPQEKEQELDLVAHILNRHKIYDITLNLINDDNILVAYDEQNFWIGKEFYDFMFNELFVYNDEEKVDLLNDEDLNQLEKYREQYEEQNQNKEEKLEIEMEME